jgi:hypothetical protein
MGRGSGYCMLPSQLIILIKMDEKMPCEVWNGKKPSLTHLTVFGYDAYVHISKENMSKLDKKDENYIFIGYKDVLKG